MRIVLSSRFEPRDYQQKCVQKATQGNTTVVIPTGGGKVVVACLTAEHIRMTSEKCVLWIVGQRDTGVQCDAAYCSAFGLKRGKRTVVISDMAASRREKMWEKAKGRKVAIVTYDIVLNDVERFPELGGIIIDSSASLYLRRSSDTCSKLSIVIDNLVSKYPTVPIVCMTSPNHAVPRIASLISSMPWTPLPPPAWAAIVPSADVVVVPRCDFLLDLIHNIEIPVAAVLQDVQKEGYMEGVTVSDLYFNLAKLFEEQNRASNEPGRKATKLKEAIVTLLHGRQLLASLHFSSFGTFLAKENSLRKGFYADQMRSYKRQAKHPILTSDWLTRAKQEIRTSGEEHPKMKALVNTIREWHASGEVRSIIICSIEDTVKPVHDHLKSILTTVRLSSVTKDTGKKAAGEAVDALRKGFSIHSLILPISKLCEFVTQLGAAPLATPLLTVVYDLSQLNDIQKKAITRIGYLTPSVTMTWLCVETEWRHLQLTNQLEADCLKDTPFVDVSLDDADFTVVSAEPSSNHNDTPQRPTSTSTAVEKTAPVGDLTSKALGICFTENWPTSLTSYLGGLPADHGGDDIVSQVIRGNGESEKIAEEVCGSPSPTLYSRLRKLAMEKKQQAEQPVPPQTLNAASASPSVSMPTSMPTPVSIPTPMSVPTPVSGAPSPVAPSTTLYDLLHGQLQEPSTPPTECNHMKIGSTYYMSGVPLSPIRKPKNCVPATPQNWLDIDVNCIHPNNPTAVHLESEAAAQRKEPENEKWFCSFCCNGNHHTSISCTTCGEMRKEGDGKASQGSQGVHSVQKLETKLVHVEEEPNVLQPPPFLPEPIQVPIAPPSFAQAPKVKQLRPFVSAMPVQGTAPQVSTPSLSTPQSVETPVASLTTDPTPVPTPESAPPALPARIPIPSPPSPKPTAPSAPSPSAPVTPFPVSRFAIAIPTPPWSEAASMLPPETTPLSAPPQPVAPAEPGLAINLSLIGRMSQGSDLSFGSDSEKEDCPAVSATPGLPSKEVMSLCVQDTPQQGPGITPMQFSSKQADGSCNILDLMNDSDEGGNEEIPDEVESPVYSDGSSDTAIVPSACVRFVGQDVVPFRDVTPDPSSQGSAGCDPTTESNAEMIPLSQARKVVTIPPADVPKEIACTPPSQCGGNGNSESNKKSRKRKFKFNVVTTPSTATGTRTVTPSTRSSMNTTVTPAQKKKNKSLRKKRRKLAARKFLDVTVDAGGDLSSETGTMSTEDDNASFIVSQGSESASADDHYRRRLLNTYSQLPSDGEGNCDVPVLTGRSPKKVKLRRRKKLMEDCLEKYKDIDDEDESEIGLSDLGEDEEEEEGEEGEESEYMVQLQGKDVCFKCKMPGHWCAECPNTPSSTNKVQRSLPTDSSFVRNTFQLHDPSNADRNKPKPFIAASNPINSKPQPFVPKSMPAPFIPPPFNPHQHANRAVPFIPR